MRKTRIPPWFSAFITVCVFAALYVALTERLSLLNAAAGFVIGVVALVLTRLLFPGKRLAGVLHPGRYIIFIGCLIWLIFKNAVLSVGCVFSGDVRVCLVRYPTALKRDMLKAMLANAISLTPGTVTADIRDDVLEVMQLCRDGKPEETRDFARMEKILLGMDRREEE